MDNIKTWDDYCNVNGDSMYFETNVLRETHIVWENNDVPLWMRKKWVAEYRINKLMPYYGGCTDGVLEVYTVAKDNKGNLSKSTIIGDDMLNDYTLCFRTASYRNDFLKHNMDLVKDYLNIK